MPRSLWNGAISFGLVHIPVSLVSATHTGGVDFDWLDKRSMDPVGYKRVNKKTGKEVGKEDIVKGVEYEKGRYVVVSEAEIRAAHPEATQTIDLFAFIDREQIPLQNIDTPYYLTPQKRGEKVYALLRETLTSTGKVGLANVIIRTRQHLAALMVVEDALVLVLLRWPAQVHPLDDLEIPESARKAKLSKAEKDMARQLVEGMSSQWQPEQYQDTFEEQIMALVETKASKGKLEEVEAPEEPKRRSADVVDLTELLKRSLGGGKPAKTKTKAKQPATRKSPKAS
ncbi:MULTISPECIES: Ku protein [unclassified Pseudomonas]|uniref:non-homologous end joining protein Ku n=1 Tax=unclassified Pseudomonas TaxID=196821 RepID=UPI000BCD1AC5|nr:MULTISPECIES: Ku protein [unclassified Pseudomonas]PVZ19575.1 Ku protein [Pseudomonas sp. URIL14HWK12:I12]PVZ22840.1 Ku protein [Pseudomonas sp. URIL14HWK12:I10]PVZ37530.1 Ku protein [Pseudomonas sp. URIL14HWK12:I11]SNZ15019.1 DNA end-binding protein Ku [Pseudomonas sp. URIL14HWK12:I9]